MLSVFVLCACNKTTPPKSDNISRITEQFYAGETTNFAVVVELGKKEKNFVADGVATNVVAFASITVAPLTKFEGDEINFTLSDGKSTFSGQLVDAINGEYTSDIQLSFLPKAVTLASKDKTFEIELKNMLEGMLSANDALNIAKKQFDDRIKNESNGVAREIYIKLITGDRLNYYYYVSFIGKGVDYWAVLINPKDGKVVSKR